MGVDEAGFGTILDGTFVGTCCLFDLRSLRLFERWADRDEKFEKNYSFFQPLEG